MRDDENLEAESIVRALANIDPVVTSEYACFYCGAGEPVDKPVVHGDDCLHLRAARWTHRRWQRDEG